LLEGVDGVGEAVDLRAAEKSALTPARNFLADPTTADGSLVASSTAWPRSASFRSSCSQRLKDLRRTAGRPSAASATPCTITTSCHSRRKRWLTYELLPQFDLRKPMNSPMRGDSRKIFIAVRNNLALICVNS
jgi:hypothetical protein